MYNVFYLWMGSTSNALKHGMITVSGFEYFHKNCRFLWEKNVSKTNWEGTTHCTYTSFSKYSRLCMVSEELGLIAFSSINTGMSNLKIWWILQLIKMSIKYALLNVYLFRFFIVSILARIIKGQTLDSRKNI